MPKTMLPFDPGGYAPVADRIALFYERHPTGRIITEMVERSQVVVFKALIYRAANDTLPAATGWASERVGDGEINAVACVENTETSSIGRALANLGFTASSRRPSAEEMEKASRERARLARERLNPPREQCMSIANSRAGLRVAEAPASAWEAGAATIDALDLLAEAERAGLDPGRAAKLRMRLEAGSVATSAIERVERALRRWLAEHEPTPAGLDVAGD